MLESSDNHQVTVAGAIRRPRVGRLDMIGDLVPEEDNVLTTGTVIDVGGVQVRPQITATLRSLKKTLALDMPYNDI